jgi:putative proteasome-type protease
VNFETVAEFHLGLQQGRTHLQERLMALRLDPGILFCSDSRTNAGVDHIATFSKMKVFAKDGDRVIVTDTFDLPSECLTAEQRLRLERSRLHCGFHCLHQFPNSQHAMPLLGTDYSFAAEDGNRD